MEKICSFPGCKKPHCAKGYCNSHWAQQRRGQTLHPIYTHESPKDRFLRNIEVDPNTDCWVWRGAGSGKYYDASTGQNGYGQLRIGGQSWMAHRWAFEEAKDIKLHPDDTLDHLCRNTRCCNPDHLEVVSRSENIDRMHLYKGLRSENDRLKQFLISLGYEIQEVLNGEG